MNVVIIVIAPTIGNTNELVAPTSVPPLATTRASSPPEEERPKAALNAVWVLYPCDLAAKYTVKNFAPIDTKISIIAGTIKSGNCVMSIKAPTETKNTAPNMSLIGVVNTLVTECAFDSAIKTPAKKAPVATDIPISNAINERPNATPRIATMRTSCWLVFPIRFTNLGTAFEPINKAPPINAKTVPTEVTSSIPDN